jgi:WXG100 family type VII secretion target
MADRITVTIQDLRDAAVAFTSRYENIGEILTELSTLSTDLGNNWAGAAQVEYAQLSAEMLKSLSSVSTDILPSISKILTSVADTMAAADAEIASSLKSSN